ncbi:hypothetical protein PFNF54_02090 [Plasmodium falciparum NF54]|uniref:Erythrocyte membrane protein 1 n=1 Tax=Plasmodium falciparum (isolate NF54) TaxID=5843 RepID=W7K7Z8_PLAFO|nr:hypothetical protein PFNF54_02090 [Plasmodium falciparum NF54]
MPPLGRQVGGSPQDDDAKNMFDRIGKDVYDQVKKGVAETYKEALTGQLSLATLLGVESASTTDPCGLDYSKLISGSGVAARGHPCGNGSGKGEDVNRFSKERVDEYDEKKIKDNKGNRGNNEGECAPYRRLSLCNKNFQKINNIDSDKARHNLLVDVCLAAHYEGDSIKAHLEQYDATYPGSGSTTCTALARSFADIGDIVRGRDLYRGNKKKIKTETERDKLEQKLKEIFKNIKKENNEKLKSLTDDQIREYWWTANRHTVWKAITCKADASSAYFHATCSDSHRSGTFSQANNYCRCNGDQPGNDKENIDPPTYFDYVPQYLRWFEEWAEDFCRKKKHKLNDAIQKCRGEDKYGKDRYCDLNGYDCEKTKRGRNMYRWDHKCTGCFLSCSHFRTWIDNQKLEFLKQKEKYTNEISGGKSRKKRAARSSSSSSYDNGYEKKFYDQLKAGGYNGVNSFLDLLSKEKTCKDITDTEGGKIDFKNVNSDKNSYDDDSNKTFSHTEYCQACPLCGVKRNGRKWERKEVMKDCPPINLYKPKKDAEGTLINFLYSGDETNEIAKKLKAFCAQANGDTTNGTGGNGTGGSVAGGTGTSGSNELYQKWKCYEIDELTKDQKEGGEDDPVYDEDVKTGGGLCILENKNKSKGSQSNSQKEPDEIQKTFNPFFYYWVVHMLKDSIHWRTKKLDKCINNSNESKACKNNNKCKDDCGCFLKWVVQKKTEWENIKKHFKKQKDIPPGFTHDDVLEGVLEKEVLLTSIKEGYGNEKDIKHIKKLLDEEEAAGVTDNENKTTIDKLLKHEKDEADKCKQIQEECNKQKQQERGGPGGRSADPSPPADLDEHSSDEGEEDDDDDEEEENANEETAEDATEDTQVDGTEVVEETVAEVTEVTEVKPCEIVQKLFTNGDLQNTFKDACEQKYGYPQRHWGWKCISDTTTGKSGDNTGSSGAICIPPRRRKLYIGKIKEWANSGNTQAAEPQEDGKAQTPQGQTPSQSGKESSQSQKLREAFIQSAAIETFFLWDRYKKVKNKEIAEKKQRDSTNPFGFTQSTSGGMQALPVGGAVQGAQAQLPDGAGGSDQTPEKQLAGGKIPEVFLRQMFYTLGDYRDICVGNTPSGIDTNDKENMQKIQNKIKSVIEKSDSTPRTPGTHSPSSGTTPQALWDKISPSIWEGMLCALTYKDGGEGKKIEKVNDANGDDLFQKLKDKYSDYKTVTLEEDNTSSAMSTSPRTSETTSASSDNTPTLNNPKLSDFVLRPPYFRYLEEWGQNFCKKRTEMLEKIKEECRSGTGGHEYCSGDGHDCTDNDRKYNKMIADFHCPGCAKECMKYKTWIGKKFEEFKKQENTYKVEHGKLTNNNCSGSDNTKFCQQIKNNSFDKFLELLRHCKDGKDDTDKDNELNFSKPLQTFSRSTYCKACPIYGVKYNRGTYSAINESEYMSKNGISGENKNDKKPTEIKVLLLGRKGEVRNNDEELKELKEVCNNAGFVEDYSLQKWNCQKKNGVDQCNLTNSVDNIDDSDKIIPFNVFFQRWLRNFVHDYNKLKQKIHPCIKNEDGKEHKCIEGCKKKCECVEKWLDKKSTEWDEIKKHYEKHSKDHNEGIPHSVKGYLVQAPFKDEVLKAIKPCDFDNFKTSCGLNGTDNSQNGNNNDLVLCMIKNLEKKIEQCKKKHDENKKTPCDPLPPLPDENDETLEENPVAQPNICPQLPEEPKETCEEAVTPSEPKKAEEEPAAEPEAVPEEEAPLPPPPPAAPPRESKEKAKPPPKPRIKTRHVLDHPAVIPALMSSTIMWSIGIASGKNTPSDTQNDIPTSDTPPPITDDEWNTLKHDFISQYLPNTQNTEPNILHDNLDNNTHPTPSRHTLDQKPFIMSIHDRDLYSGEEISYNIHMSTNSMDDPKYVSNNVYSGIDLINDTLSGNKHIDIYDEVLKRKENELFGTNYKKNTSNNSVTKNINSDPIDNQLNLFHTWLDRHRDMCEQWNNKEELLDKLKEEWENETHSGNKHSDIPSGKLSDTPSDNNIHSDIHPSDIPSGKQSDIPSDNNIHSDIPYVLNTDVSIQIDMDNPKTTNEFTYVDSNPNQVDDTYVDSNPDNSSMDTILEDLEKYNEPYYDVQDDIYYDVNDHDTSTVDSNAMDIPSKVQIEMDVNTKLVKEKYPIGDVWDI